MKTIELDPEEIIASKDYPLHSDKALNTYFKACKRGEILPLVPVIRKDVVKKHLTKSLLPPLEMFEKKHPQAAFFMLDGNHRTTASALTGRPIAAILFEKDKDIREAKTMVRSGKVCDNPILDNTLLENCRIINQHFLEQPVFLTVKEKTEQMAREGHLAQYMIDAFRKRS